MKMQVYEPNKHLKLGIRIWRKMFAEMYLCRELTWRLFLRDLSAKYRQALLGNLWIAIMPFIAIGTFMYLNKAGLIEIGETDIPYPLYALIGITVYQLFSSGLQAGTQSLVNAGDMITKINFPRETLVIASMGQAVFEFLIKFGLIVLFFFIFRFIPHWQIVFLPIVLLPLLILTVGLGLLLSLLNGVFRDTGNVVSLLTTFLMFLTPVLYPVPEERFYFFKANILTALVNAPRDVIAYGYIQDPGHYAVAAALSLLIFLMSWRTFHLAETKIPERV